MEEISQELAARMAGLVRDLHADHVKHGAHDYVQDFVARTAEIAALLPVPVDQDLVEAREILASHAESKDWPNNAKIWRSGSWDAEHSMVICLTALKRGRELAKARAGEGSGE